MDRTYVAIDLKSFYASQECISRGLDPLRTNLVVADSSRTEKTICLAVSPSLKAYGIPGRARLFEVVQKVREVNALRRSGAPNREFSGKTWDADALDNDPSLELDYITAVPRMALYMESSTKIYDIYLKYVSKDDIHVYSIDEVFIDATHYLSLYNMTGKEFVSMLIREVLASTGITATGGVGSNLYLCKIAMDIVAKHVEADDNGVRIAELDERSYRRQLWTHRPITDFWRVGRGYAKKLASHGMFTMGDIARCSLENEALLYKLFGVNAELLIDHAWGWEPCTIAEIKKYKPGSSSLGSGQVLHEPTEAETARLITQEMADALALDLVDKGLVSDQMVLTVGYDRLNLADPQAEKKYSGEITVDFYGRKIPKHAHGSINLGCKTSSSKIILDAVTALYDRIVDPSLLVRRINLTANHVLPDKHSNEEKYEQLDFFAAPAENQSVQGEEREMRRQKAVLQIKKKYGKNAIVKGMNLRKGATAMDRNRQIGGHKA